MLRKKSFFAASMLASHFEPRIILPYLYKARMLKKQRLSNPSFRTFSKKSKLFLGISSESIDVDLTNLCFDAVCSHNHMLCPSTISKVLH